MRQAENPARWRLAVSAALVLGPLVAVVTREAPFTAIVLFSLLGALNAALLDERTVGGTTVATAVVTVVAVLLTGTGPALPVLGTALVVLLAGVTAALAPRGLMAVGVVEIILTAHLLIDPAALDSGLTTSRPLWRVSLILAGVAFVASAWVLAIRAVLLPGRRAAHPVAPGIPYGAILAVVCGLFTLICLLLFQGTNLWWTVMTAALVLQPAAADTLAKALARTAGTFAGGIVAAVVAAVIPVEGVVRLLGVLAAVACVVLTLAGSAYWLYSTAVTVSVILLTYTRAGFLGEDAQRIVCTVVAAAVSVAAVMVVERLGAARTAPAEPGPPGSRPSRRAPA